MKKGLVMLAAVLMFSLLSGFSGSAQAQGGAMTDARFEALSKELYPKAKQEGEVIVYSVWDVQDVVGILDAFSKQYPGIKTTYWQARNPELITKVITEFKSDQKGVDVILSDSAPPVLRAAGTIMPYETVQKDVLILHDPTMPVVSMQIQAVAYNTKKLKAEDAPKNLEDIATPKYKGIVALDDPMRGGPFSTQLAALKENWKDDAKWTRFVKGLKALNVPVHRSTSAMFRLLVSGEYSIALPVLLVDLAREQEKGSPIDYVKSIPPILFARYGAIYAKSPHPNASKLFVEWMISPAGQAAVDSVGREVSRKGFPSNTAIDKFWSSDLKPIGVSDRVFLEDPKKWLDAHVKPLWE
ncbi:MAG: extracellular solute-binding protein [Thermodesulfobacteriota bacterium]